MSVCIQLPNDVIGRGYREVRPYHHEQVFHSPSLDFTGTAAEFLKAGHAYSYVQIDKFTRRIVEGNPPTPVPDTMPAEPPADPEPPTCGL